MRILTRIFAFIGFMVVLSLTISLVAALFMGEKQPGLPERVVLNFDFGRDVSDTPNDTPLALLMGNNGVQLRMLVLALDRASKDPKVAGLVANLSDVSLNLAQIEEVRAALGRFTAAGKFAYAYASSFGELGPGNRAYWLATAFTNIRLQPMGLVGLTGATISQPFFRTALDRIGIVPDVHQRYEYKGAAGNLTEANLPAPLRENYQTLLNDIHGNMVRDIAASRKIDEAELRRLIDRAPIMGEAALAAKLIDSISYQDEMNRDALAAAGSLAGFYDLADYLRALPAAPVKSREVTALVYINGPIVNRTTDRGPLGEQSVAGADEIAQALTDAANAPGVSSIVIRINSPGGSVSASETIWHAIKQIRAAGKYVVVSMGDTAASGGYWIASAADYIVANPSTLTGSIGVVAGKLVIGPVSQKFGINWSTLTTGANSGMWAPNVPFSGNGLRQVETSLDEIYTGFTQRVEEGRNLTPEQVDKLARGRVWTGAHAKELGLVDELGGLREAFNQVRRHAGMKEDAPMRLAVFPKPDSPGESVIKLLRQLVEAPRLAPLSWEQMSPLLAAALHLPGTQPGGTVYYAGPELQ